MNSYNPDAPPNSTDWLEIDEGDRIELVASYHRRQDVRLPNAQLHAVIHVIVENQLALAEPVVVETLDRLQGEGLSRHDALHAIGLVLAEDIYQLMQGDSEATTDVYNRYLGQLRKLTAANWRAG
jgi:hypothetical protein